MKKMVIIGNCQAQMLEGIFLSTKKYSVSRLKPVFQMTEADRSHTMKIIDEADIVFSQRVSKEYHLEWVRGSFLKEIIKERCIIYPNIYFDGYFPGSRYIYLEKGGKVNSPLEDYHFDEVLKLYRGGVSVSATLVQLEELPRSSEDPFENSIRQLRSREEDCDVQISDEIQRAVFDRQCFYTPNHPDNQLLTILAERLANAANLEFDFSKALTWPYRLDKIQIPPFPGIMRRYPVQFTSDLLYKGLTVTGIMQGKVYLGDTKLYNLKELIEQYYKIYDVVFS